MTCMNYGYAPLEGEMEAPGLHEREEAERHALQLYLHLAGGAAYLARTLAPRRLVGLDRCEAAVEFCRRRHAVPGLEFRPGDAERLPFPDASFDVVLNVESSHGYGSVPRFLGEVRRVLRPGGVFLYTDHRNRWELDGWRGQIRESGLELLEETDITDNVVEALDRSNARKQALIDRKCPAWFRGSFQEFAAVQGSVAYERFRVRRNRYLAFRLRKEGAGALR
jgi:SAM-dependent methyltransferase